jgi:hypothetical protein
MARARRKPLFPIALSPAATADALQIRLKVVRDAILSGALPAYQTDRRVRVLVADLVEWVRTWPRARS